MKNEKQTQKQTDKELLASILTYLKRIHWVLKVSPNTWQTFRDVHIYEPTFFNKSLVPSLNDLAKDFNFVGRSAQKLPEPLAKDVLALLARLNQGMLESLVIARQFANNEGWAIRISPKEVNDTIIQGYITTYEKEKEALLDLIGKIEAEQNYYYAEVSEQATQGKRDAEKDTKEQSWKDDASDYMSNSEAIVNYTQSKMSLPKLSKLLKHPDNKIRFMRKGQKCKVHIGDFRKYAKQKYIPDKLANEIADEIFADREARQAEEKIHKKKTGK